MPLKAVVAFGGNALGKTPREQLKKVKNTSKAIADLTEAGYEIIITHGNGPQVGMINQAFEYAASRSSRTPYMPFAECGAMSQGYIGYHLQQAIQKELAKRKIRKGCVSLITQVAVDENDPAFQNFTKPVGTMFYTKNQAAAISRETGYVFMEDSGRGWRRVVPSPHPERIIELDMIRMLAEAGNIVIAAGGGGIPVARSSRGTLKGVAAVIDKDHTSSLLARQLGADILLILTTVEKVCINFGKKNETQLDEMTVEQAEKYIGEGQFGTGSMLPKVEACIDFAKTGGTAIISSLDSAREAVAGTTGTRIVL